jgi:hypothetical protein
VIASRSRRTFFDALYLARLPEPTRRAEIGERFLDLLVAGIDHELVGFDVWYDRILGDAPDVAADAGE